MNDWINNPLIKAASEGNLPEVQRLVAEGSDIEARGGAGTTALSFAAFEGHIPVVEFLISRGADTNALGYEDCPPLGLAAYSGQIKSMGLLVDAGADINAVRPRTGESPLHFAVLKRQVDAVSFLLTHGADKEARTGSGVDSDSLRNLRLEHQTPLHLAAGYADVATVKVLLEAGADTTATDDLGLTPLLLSERREGQKEIVEILKRYAEDGRKA